MDTNNYWCPPLVLGRGLLPKLVQQWDGQFQVCLADVLWRAAVQDVGANAQCLLPKACGCKRNLFTELLQMHAVLRIPRKLRMQHAGVPS